MTTHLSHSGTKFFRDTQGYNKQIFIGVRFTIKRAIDDVQDAFDYIQDNYFCNPDVSGSGHFWLMPPAYRDEITSTWSRKIDRSISSGAITNHGETTTIDVLFVMMDYEDLEEEYSAVSEELNLFVKHGFAEKWEQFPLY